MASRAFRHLVSALTLIASVALLQPRAAHASGGWTSEERLLLLGTVLTAPLPVGSIFVGNVVRRCEPSSFGWGVAQLLIATPHLVAGVALTGMGLSELLTPERTADAYLLTLFGGGASVLFAGLMTFGVRELVSAYRNRGAPAALVPSADRGNAPLSARLAPIVVRGDRGDSQWGIGAAGTF